MKMRLSVLLLLVSSLVAAQSVHLVVPAVDSAGNAIAIGTAYISWGQFLNNAGIIVQAGAVTRQITSGAIDVTLTASDSAGYVYTVLLMRGSTPNTFKWRVPAAGAATMAALNEPPVVSGLPVGAIVGTTDVQTLTNKSIDAAEINSGVLDAARIPAPRSAPAYQSLTLPQIFSWYVDSVNGLDSNTGRSLAQAYRTIGKLQSQALAVGDSVCLASGSTWRERLNLPQNNMLVAGCGPGSTAPVLDGSDLIASGSWSKTAGQTNVYQATVSLETTGNDTFVNTFYNGVFLPIATSIANCDATPGSYFPSSHTAASITLYVHAPGNTNPGSDGNTYEYTHRLNGITADPVTGSFISGITARRPLSQTGAFDLGRYSTLVNSTAVQSGEHAVYAQSGSFVENVIARDAYWGTHTGIMFVAYDQPVVDGVTFSHDTAVMSQAIGSQQGFYGHSGSGTWPYLTIDNCAAINVLFGFGGTNATVVNANNDSAIVVGAGAGFSVESPMIITGGSVTSASASMFGVQMAANNADVTIGGLTTNLSAPNAKAVGQSTPVANSTIRVYGSTLISGGANIDTSGTGASVIAAGNTFESPSASTFLRASGSGSAISSDSNMFYVPVGSAAFSLIGTNYANLAAWTAASGNDTHSTSAAGTYPLTQVLFGSGLAVVNGGQMALQNLGANDTRLTLQNSSTQSGSAILLKNLAGNTYFDASAAGALKLGGSSAGNSSISLMNSSGLFKEVFGPAWANHVLASDMQYCWNSSTNASSGACDMGMSRLGPASVAFGNGTAGDKSGTLNAARLALTTSVAATCASAIRGLFQYTAGGAGVKDVVQVCAKDAADAYAWRPIY